MQDVELLDVVYNDVPAVELPKSGGGVALFTDTSETTATASDVLNSKYFYDSSGNKVQGTAVPKNDQIYWGSTRTNSTSLTKLLELTCNKTGLYHVYWTCVRMATNSGFGAQLYIDDVAYGSLVTNFANNVHTAHLYNVPLSAGQKAAVYAKSSGSSYYVYVPIMVIMEA